MSLSTNKQLTLLNNQHFNNVNQTSQTKKTPIKYKKSRYKSIPTRRNKKSILVKAITNMEKDNYLYETVLAAYSKENYGNAMKQKALEMKERELVKKLRETKLRVNRKNVENCENLKQILFYKDKINSLKQELSDETKKETEKILLKLNQLNNIETTIKLTENDLKERRKSFKGRQKAPKAFLKGTNVCEEHRKLFFEKKDESFKRFVGVDAIVGDKVENGEVLRLVKWVANPFLKNRESWECVCDGF